MKAAPPFPGIQTALDGSAAVVAMETAASEAAGAYPITPSTQMGEGWAAAIADGKQNVNGRRLLFFEPEGEHAAAGVTAGMSMMGLRATNFSSGQGIVYMHESLYPAVGKRLTYVLNVAARAITKQALNVHAGHDDYHAVDDTGFFQLFAKDVQEVADLNLIAHRIAEQSLNPGLCAQDGFLTSHVIELARLPERALIKRFLGDPSDLIDSPTPAQRLVFGDQRRRIPEMFDFDYPAMLGVVANQDSYAQGVAAQRPFYFDHVAALTDAAFAEYEALTGRHYERVSGYRLDDAEYVIAGQGSVVANAEAVCDWMRKERGLKVGVLNLRMFRPFPADLVTKLLAGKKAVVVLERTDQPLAVDAPLLREIRAAMAQGTENWRAHQGAPSVESRGFFQRAKKNGAHAGATPFARLADVAPDAMPDFYSGCFGLGSRDLQPGDIIAAVDNMLPEGTHRRQFYLGIEFVREGTRHPKLQIWQEKLQEAYPHIGDLALTSAGDINVMPESAVSLRIHSVGGWGAITMGKNVAMTVFELFGMHIKANPKYGSEKKGQPTTFYATFAHEPIRLNCELRHVNVVLSPDPNVFRNSDPLAGLADGGVFVIQSDAPVADVWASLPAEAQRAIRDRHIKLFAIDAFKIAMAEASDVELRYRMQGAAFMGAFFRASPLLEREGATEDKLFAGIRKQLTKKFGHLGEQVVEDNLRVIRRGFDEVQAIDYASLPAAAAVEGVVPVMPVLLDHPTAGQGIGNQGRFWEQVCSLCKTGQDGIADPFAAISAMPAATSAMRDMTDVRMEVPSFIAENCTGCGQCWTQCPDAAIPGLVSDIDSVLEAGMRTAANGHTLDRMKQVVKPLAKELRKVIAAAPLKAFGAALDTAYPVVAGKLGWDGEKRAALDTEFAAMRTKLADFPLARTAPFFTAPESRKAGTGGLLSITVNPEACKGCNLCVEVCPDGALVTVKQEDSIVNRLREHWKVWQQLPDTADRFINIASLEEGIGTLPSLLLKKQYYRSMVGGDGACMGCGEKTAVHLVVSTVEALMRPRVEAFVVKLDALIATLDAQARTDLAKGASLEEAASTAMSVALPLDGATHERIKRLNHSLKQLRDLRWRYTEGPSGNGRAPMGMVNSTGCSSVWGSTYPYNPYPFPWANHLFQDAPSVAIGVFEGHMRKMADAFVAVRRAERLADGSYDAKDEQGFTSFDWKQFTDDELMLCPPILSMGGDGAMLDIGFQNLSRLLASGKPIRVIVLDTQVYSNTGGQACTSGFTGQVSDMAQWGGAQHGKTEARKELSLIAMAHRGAFVHQTSAASPSHLIAGVIKGLHSRRPAVFSIYTPCPVEHGLADDWSHKAAKLALESRAFPFVTFDPDAGKAWADCVSLEGNPAIDDAWPTYTLEYVDDTGATKSMELPLTIADWAATEGRFKKHFRSVPEAAWDDTMVPFHEMVAMPAADREGKTAFIHTIDKAQKLSRLSVTSEMVALAEERQRFWWQLRELAGVVRAGSATSYEEELAALKRDYEKRIADLKATYPAVIARRLAESLLHVGNGSPMTVTPPPVTAPAVAVAAAAEAPAPVAVAAPAPAAVAVAEPDDDAISFEAYIETLRCTSCNECTNLNSKMFAYDANKQAYIKDARAGTFQQLVTAAERCPVSIIHPGTPLNEKEKDLDKWKKRAERFS